MTQIIFYVNVPDRRRFLYGLLTKKLLPRELRVYIAASDEKEASELDNYLWTAEEGGFLPHTLANDENAVHSPIVIGIGEPADDFQAQVIVPLQVETPSSFGRFDYLIDIAESQHVNSARKRYKFYKEHGYPLDYHNMNQHSKKPSNSQQ